MSLEAALAENTKAQAATQAALSAVAELLRESNAGRAEAVAALAASGGAAEPAAPKPRGRPPKAAATDTPPAAAPQPAPAAQAAQAAVPTVEKLREVAGRFMGVEDEATRAERKTTVKGIIDHLGVGKIVEVAETDRAKVIGWLQAAGRGEKFSMSGEEDAPVEAEDDMLG